MKATVSVTHRGTAAACCFVNNSIQKQKGREISSTCFRWTKKCPEREGKQTAQGAFFKKKSGNNIKKETLLTLVCFLIISYINKPTKISRDETFCHLLQDHPPNGPSLRQINICLAPHLDGSPHLQPQVVWRLAIHQTRFPLMFCLNPDNILIFLTTKPAARQDI